MSQEGREVERDNALDMAVSQIERQFGKGTVMRMGDTEQVAIPSVSTGSLGLDIALGIGDHSAALEAFSEAMGFRIVRV